MSEYGVAQPRPHVAQPARRARSSHIWLATALFGLGCSSRGAGSGYDGSGVKPNDAAASVCAQNCTAEALVCSLGRCVSMACAMAESNSKSTVGCLFYTLQADNVAADEAAETAFLIANAGPNAADVRLEVATPSAGGGNRWMPVTGAEAQVPVSAAASLPITGKQITGSGLSEGGALRVVSDQPVSVAEVESDALTQPPTSSGGTALLPLQALDSSYRVVTYVQSATMDVLDVVGSRGGAGRLMIVGTQAATSVRVQAARGVTVDAGGVAPQALAAEDALSFQIGDGDVVQIYSDEEGADLSGTSVTADAPLAVFSGNISTTYGSSAAGINSADMAHEQMPPVKSWSTTYVAPALTPETNLGCNSFFGPAGGSIWRVVAAADDTHITVSGPGVTQPSPFPTMNAGDVQTLIATGSFTVSSKLPILVTQGIDCEPSLSLAVGVDGGALPASLAFAAPPSFDLQLAIVRPQGAAAPVMLDGNPVPGLLFTSAGGPFEVATVPLPACAPTTGTGPCFHQLTSSAGIGMTLRGMDVLSSFALTTPSLSPCGIAGSCPN